MFAGCAVTHVSRPIAPFTTTVGLTGSMHPALIGGEPIYVYPVNIADLVVGDLVVIWWEGREIDPIHRVHKIIHGANGQIGIQTKGDNNAICDPYIITQADLIGKVKLL